MKNVLVALSWVRLIPHLGVFLLGPAREAIRADLGRWESRAIDPRRSSTALSWDFARVMTDYPEFRNLFYYRIRSFSKMGSIVLKPFCRPMASLFVRATTIGPGLFIQHGYGTGITATSVGRDCWINQHVTVGYNDDARSPIIGDRVRIGVGARVLGPITVGSDVTVGANAVVTKDVPPGCVVAGVPARIIRRDGHRVDEPL